MTALSGTYIDPGLLEYCTEGQRRVLQAIIDTGSLRGAERVLGISHKNFTRVIRAVELKAAAQGYAPKHDMVRPAPAPFLVKGVSTLYNKDGEVAAQWVKTNLEKSHHAEAIKEWVETLSEDVKGLSPLPEKPKGTHNDLLAVYAVGDPHFGLYAWAQEAGDDFDLDKATKLTAAAVDRLVSSAPPAKTALILELGDLLHADNASNQTPTSGHALDVDTRYAKVMQVALKALRHAILRALEKHEKVYVWLLGGNHDPHSSYAIAMCLHAYFENNPRVVVDQSPAMFRYMSFGKVMIGATHGHTTKIEALPQIMATDKPREWGDADYRYWYIGHIHHKRRQEFPGAVVESFRTLAARDAWHTGKGYRAGRDMELIVHHREYGEIERHRADIAMLTPKKKETT